MTARSRIIALDADGVLLNYNEAYRAAWHKAFGVWLHDHRPRAYSAIDRWRARVILNPVELFVLRAAFDANFWRTMRPMPGAVQACLDLHAAGYELVCVTALGPEHQESRLQNLRDLGMPIERCFATGHAVGTTPQVSPKAAVIEALQPVAFVDDYAVYLRGIAPSVHLALIESGLEGSPNVGADLNLAHSVHADLRSFSRYWLNQHRAVK